MNSNPDRHHGEANQNHWPPKKTLVVRVFRTIKRQLHRYKRYRQKKGTEHQINERMMARWTRRLGYFTIVLTIITGVTGWILYETNQTLKDTLAASNSANRAFIFFRDLASGQIEDKDKSTFWTFVINLENNGNTQAKNAKMVTACDDAAIKDIFIGKTKASATRVFGPKQIVGSGGCTWTSKVLENGHQSGASFYIGGIVQYDDIFGGSHVTKYCRAIQILGDPQPKGARPENTTSLCPDLHDCADQECQDH